MEPRRRSAERPRAIRVGASMPRFTVTVRHGRGGYRYHTFEVEAVDLPAAMKAASNGLPDDVRDDADLVEIRLAPEGGDRPYLGEA